VTVSGSTIHGNGIKSHQLWLMHYFVCLTKQFADQSDNSEEDSSSKTAGSTLDAVACIRLQPFWHKSRLLAVP